MQIAAARNKIEGTNTGRLMSQRHIGVSVSVTFHCPLTGTEARPMKRGSDEKDPGNLISNCTGEVNKGRRRLQLLLSFVSLRLGKSSILTGMP